MVIGKCTSILVGKDVSGPYRAKGVELDHGNNVLFAHHVIVATGAWTSQLHKWIKVVNLVSDSIF